MKKNSSSERQQIELLKEKVEEKVKIGPSEQWRNRHFVALAELIQKETKEQISISTLKRIWGKVKSDGLPSYTSLNVLAHFIGYVNFADFKASVSQNKSKGLTKKHLLLALIPLVLVLVVLSFIFLAQEKATTTSGDGLEASLKARKTFGTIPRTIVLDYSIKGASNQHFYLGYDGPDGFQRQVEELEGQMSFKCEYPGYTGFYIKAGEQTIAKERTFNKTDGWMVYNQNFRQDSIYQLHYMRMPRKQAQAWLSLPKDTMSDRWKPELIDSSSKMDFIFADKFEHTMDKLVFKARLRHDMVTKGRYPYKTSFGVFGTEGFWEIPLISRGNSIFTWLFVSDSSVDGKKGDLTAYETDMEGWKEIEVLLNKKTLTYKLNGLQIGKTPYKKSMGKIIGIKFSFVGQLWLDRVSLLTLEGDTVFHDGFE